MHSRRILINSYAVIYGVFTTACTPFTNFGARPNSPDSNRRWYDGVLQGSST